MLLVISTENIDKFSVAFGDEKIEKIISIRKKYRHAEFLLKTINALIDDWKKITGIIVVRGPGGFSATRIGIATANALSYALNIPVVGVKSESVWNELSENDRMTKILLRGLRAFTNKKTENFVKPFYDAEPHITIKGKSS